MIAYTINGEKRQGREVWQEVTLAEYVRVLSAAPEQAALLLGGLSEAEYQAADFSAEVLLSAAVALLDEPVPGFRPAWLPFSLGGDTIGKMELCRLFLSQHEDTPAAAYPFLYAVYAWPEEYDVLLAISGAGFPQPLIERASCLPVTECIGAIGHILQEMERIGKRYSPILDKEPTIEQVEAGIDVFEKYGFYATLTGTCEGDLTRMAQLLQVPADVFYTALCVSTERAEYEEKYRDIISRQK